MDQETLVDRQIEDGERFVAALRADNVDVTAACWAKISDDGQWFFYIALEAVDQFGLAEAYRRVYATLRRMDPPCSVEWFRVKLIGARNPIAVDLLGIQPSRSAPLPVLFRGSRLGNVAIDEAYVYSAAVP